MTMSTTIEHGVGSATFADDEIRVEGREKVSGRAQYSADAARPGMLWAAFVRSTVAHARIVSIEATAAKQLPGVHAVLTGADIGEHFLGRALLDWPVLATDRVRFIGDTVVAIAAETRAIAEEAARLIDVTYDELPASFTPSASLAPDALVLHENPERYPFLGPKRRPVPHPNVQGYDLVTLGDLEAAFSKAERTFEDHYTIPAFHGGYIEPRATLVWLDEEDVAHVYSTNKSPYALRAQLAACTGRPKESFVIEADYIGGDFGAKGLSVDEFQCFYLAQATRRPVKYVRPYVEDMQATNLRHPAEIAIRSGVMRDGTLIALDIRVRYNGGAYAAGKPIPTLLPGGTLKTPYKMDAARFERTSVYTNTVPKGHVRAPGDVQIVFSLESHLDHVAAELGLDPLDFRRRNVIEDEETPDIDGTPYPEPRGADVLDALRAATHWDVPPAPGRARGIAISVRHVGGGKGVIVLRLQPHGRIHIATGWADQGSGLLTVLQRVLGAELGIERERITLGRVPTASAPEDPGAGGSRGTHIMGQAALIAAAALRTALEDVGWDGSPATWDEVVDRLREAGHDEFMGTYASGHGHGREWSNFSGYGVELSVDRETGEIDLHDVVLVADVGTVINPLGHRGQLDGGFAFGIGYALTEEIAMDDGRLVNASFADYKVPCQRDMPPFRVIELPPTGGQGPYGAKAAGESSQSGIAPAIANAVAAACGVRLKTLPLTAERVFDALKG